MRKYRLYSWAVLFSIFYFSEGCLYSPDDDILRVEVGYDYYIQMQVDNATHPTDYNLTIVFSWNVSEDANITGFLYKFGDIDGDELFRKKRFIPGLEPPQSFAAVCDDVRESMWAVAPNGSSVECEVPCPEYMEGPCPYGGVCLQIKSGYRAISRERRTLSFPIQFGRPYEITIVPYHGWSVGHEFSRDIKNDVVFCRHQLITSYGTDPDIADEFCRENQNLGKNSHTTGPISNITMVQRYRNMTINRGVAVFQWQKPHDVHPNVTIVQYDVNVRENGQPDPGQVLASLKTNDGFYELVVKHIIFDKTVELRITPITNTTGCSRCTEYGVLHVERFQIPDIDACSGDNMTGRYCTQIANCVDYGKTVNMAAHCVCPPGYTGNGVDPSFHGEGCTDFPSCSDNGERNITCVPEAICYDEPPPSMGVTCACPDSYIGDGYRSRMGCREQSLVIGLGVGIPAAIIAILAVVFCILRWRKIRKRELEIKMSHFLNGEIAYTSPVNGKVLKNGHADNATETGLLGEKFELDRDLIELKGIIGRGNFGVVQKATLKTNDGQTLVAVKMTSDHPTEALKLAFLSEISMLGNIGSHDNLIGMIGCCTIGEGPILMVSEYMKYGDLLHFLWKAREQRYRDEDPIYNLTELNIYQITSQVACGMKYLKEIKVIHGDLAARNVLVGEGLKCKISDFGLANDVYKYGMIKGAVEKTVPIKWISPERMMEGKMPITWRSDVWSFGILLYEAITLGASPYPDVPRDQIFEKLKSGYRMKKPDYCSQYLFNIMSKCWEMTPSKRPTFKTLEEDLKAPYTNPDTDTYVNLSAYVPNLDYENVRGEQTFSTVTPSTSNNAGGEARDISEVV